MYPDSFSVSKGEREGKISLGRQNLKTQSGFGCRERGKEMWWSQMGIGEGLLLSCIGEGCLPMHEEG